MSQRLLLRLLTLSILLGPLSVWACATCGLTQSFTPSMFLISAGFFLMPMLFAALIGWRVYKDTQRKKALSRAQSPKI